MNFYRDLSSPSSLFGAYASASASIMLLRTMFSQLIPPQLQKFILNFIRRLFKTKSSKLTLLVEQNDGVSMNQIFEAAETYLCSKIGPSTECLKISKSYRDNNLTVRFAGSEKIVDTFDGFKLEWKFVREDMQKSAKVMDEESNKFWVSEKRYFELTFDKVNRDEVLGPYINFVLRKAKEIREQNKVVKLHTLSRGVSYSGCVTWDSIKLEHPFTFDTLAMDSDQKKAIIQDLDRFVKRKDFYKKVGKAWKRGYLLYGPPGTGKSSLIAAMANHLKFDIYDLQLMNVRHDSDWRKLLLSTSNKSILVIEDIDCSTELPMRNKEPTPPEGRNHDLQFSLSGLLNFIDGLWSCAGDERIIIFTTNNRDKLDPALLRPGRMDMHIHMSYLTFHGFKLLASNYLDITDHSLFPEIEELIKSIDITPAEVAEELMKSEDVDLCLSELVESLRRKKREKIEAEIAETEGPEVVEAN